LNKIVQYLDFVQQRRSNMKKSLKKLTLNRETLQSLEARKLHKVAGGDSVGIAHPFQVEATGCDCGDPYPPTACFGTCSCGGTY
jgi:natural product precursor